MLCGGAAKRLHFRGRLERFRAKWIPVSREENASKQESLASVLIQSEPKF
jgi:hypothetical protein